MVEHVGVDVVWVKVIDIEVVEVEDEDEVVKLNQTKFN